jgi:hypothetical protein
MVIFPVCKKVYALKRALFCRRWFWPPFPPLAKFCGGRKNFRVGAWAGTHVRARGAAGVYALSEQAVKSLSRHRRDVGCSASSKRCSATRVYQAQMHIESIERSHEYPPPRAYQVATSPSTPVPTFSRLRAQLHRASHIPSSRGEPRRATGKRAGGAHRYPQR